MFEWKYRLIKTELDKYRVQYICNEGDDWGFIQGDLIFNTRVDADEAFTKLKTDVLTARIQREEERLNDNVNIILEEF